MEEHRLRVSDAERAAVVEILGQATSDGRLTLDEYSERAASAYAARTRADLAGLTDDLPAGREVQPLRQRAPAPLHGEIVPAAEKLSAVFGSDVRRGAFALPERMTAAAYFGEVKIELQDAHLTRPYSVIEATAIFGSVTIYVPEGVDVRLTGPAAVFGGKVSKLRGGVPPGSPVLEVRAKVWFGEVSVRPPRSGWLDRLGLT
ncbi:hypothetical protein J2S43_000069 [Catenuloplanes nepalensis]|uniref:Cell wall-active antibiotics response LiaF-like C-terminal domain-containing protein n=1 Tax=Catenuloplanes nepalensis TaxID=587533 RepID=A0ABT9MJF6_9ACTN|nr:DUF1707 domain-containing protein [Catenuloplanes nepalensis]MDP9791557.1 hypothetical protein [Catenuloplanes nepalensis]